ncbi:MAG: OOP family porin [Saliniramus fredricksonii]|uniref:OOP family porin n=1 Tax=Saliniramus fredricksonii TaxID=1653334 RepID=A0A0P7X8S4_9HYPH|nr:OmpA family protein [Saliniramus fredricksonii]KPQ11617.1 MAG: OOP family porin [Saliniramus fredricksonii]SCC80356.1 OmpA family protein [Saliniramus fredricksonii]
MRLFIAVAILCAGATSAALFYEGMQRFGDLPQPEAGASLAATDAPQDNRDSVAMTGSITSGARADEAGAGNATNGESGLTLRRSDARIRVNGTLPDLDMVDLFRETARERFPTLAFESGLRADSDLDPGIVEAGIAGMIALSRLAAGEARIADGIIAVEGEALYAQTQESLMRGLDGRIPEGWEMKLTISEPALPEIPDIAMCQAEISEKLADEPIVFASGATSLGDEAAPLMDSLAILVDECAPAPVEIGGHTDSDGPAETNLRLSQERADSVRDALIARGIDAARLTAVGYGETEPLVPNDSDANKGRNRRIEFLIIE